MTTTKPRLLALEPTIQYYAWGDKDYLPQLLGISNPEGRPHAELWMGAHPDLPTPALTSDGPVPLNDLIARSPEDWLGAITTRRFGNELPFLLKILSAREPLSIQAHPNRDQAREGYERERSASTNLEWSERSYRDPRHKPELLVALTEFHALVGFRPLHEIQKSLDETPELAVLGAPRLESVRDLQTLYETWMRAAETNIDAALGPLLGRLRSHDADNGYGASDVEYWLLEAHETHSKEGRPDRGLLSFYLLNLVHLRPGDGVFLDAGCLHSYLRGSGVELMASSNNVLRGGLTQKRVDVPELLRTIVYDPAPPTILRPESSVAFGDRYETPADEFNLDRIQLEPGRGTVIPPTPTPAIVVLTHADGPVRVEGETATLTLSRGRSAFVPAGVSCTLRSEVDATLFRASVPWKPVQNSFRGRTPAKLRFGTSGLRGKVEEITDLEVYINTVGFFEYLKDSRQVAAGDVVSLAGDLRPSTDGAERSILRAVAKAALDSGMKIDHLGRIPTPALTLHGIARERASIMVTGSHIPFDRNGIKFNKPGGEVAKADERAILEAVARVREREYERPQEASLFDDDGSLKAGEKPELPIANNEGRDEFARRLREFFPENALRGLRVVVFQHSAVGRDLVAEVLESLGASVVPAGRTEHFLPIDTEDISAERLSTLQTLSDDARRDGSVDAIVSTDGDSDRPLVAGVGPGGEVRFFGGDLLGILVADFLEADAVCVPVSVNDAVDLWFRSRSIPVRKTRIGSPYVIASMEEAVSEGFQRVVGWEANGGFLTGSRFDLGGRALGALPTRDALLPIASVLYLAASKKRSIVDLFAELPPRYSKAGLLDEFPRDAGAALVARYACKLSIERVDFDSGRVNAYDERGERLSLNAKNTEELLRRRTELADVMSRARGFGEIVSYTMVDGLRVFFDNGDIAHVRPSGNAPQLRLYAVADSQARADEIVAEAIREPDGLLRQLEKGAAG